MYAAARLPFLASLKKMYVLFLDRFPVQKKKQKSKEARTCAASKQREIKITPHNVPSQES